MSDDLARWVIAAVLLVTACGGPGPDGSSLPDLPDASTTELIDSIRADGMPAVVNVWASWCAPCRSEAPLLSAAASSFSGEVAFIGLNVQDSQSGAKGFIVEFLNSAPMRHLFDRDSSTVADLGGSSGVPQTIFMNADGSVAKVHFGVIDERTLAIEIDELLQSVG